MLPQIQAGEILDHATAVALGSATLKKGDHRKIRGVLVRQARGRTKRAPRAGMEALAAMGIGVEIADG